MEFFIIENSNNKLHEIRTPEHISIFISYETPVCIYYGIDGKNALIINRYYKGYSHTTNKHLILAENEYRTHKELIYVDHEKFQYLLNLIYNSYDGFLKEFESLYYKYTVEVKQLQQIKSNDLKNIPAIKESTTIKDTRLKTRNKIINQNTTTTGIKFKVIHTKTKTGRLLKSQMKLDKNYNLLSVY